jgi:hypothetical protein
MPQKSPARLCRFRAYALRFRCGVRIAHLEILCLLKRIHHYQRGRKSITGLRFKLRELIGTGRLVVVG